MRYSHIALEWSLEGQNTKRLITEAEKEGFQGLYSKVANDFCNFFAIVPIFENYDKILAQIKPQTKMVMTQEDKLYLPYHRVRVLKLPSFGELFKNNSFPGLIFSLVDDSADFERYPELYIKPQESKEEPHASTWFACWTTDEKSTANTKEALENFVQTILRVAGCDKPIEKLITSDTCSLTHQRIINNLKDYNFKQVAFKENKHLFGLLSQKEIKDVLIDFSKKGSILLSDFTKGLSNDDKDATERRLSYMSSQGLLEKSLIVICNKKNVWWNMTIPSVAVLKELEKTSITCTTCGAKITEERVDTLYKISDKGTKLVAGSYWMVGKIVDILRKLDFKDEDIFSGITYGGDELDVAALNLSRLLIFELKDREFNLGDAYKFFTKISRLKEKSTDTKIIPIVLTTKSIAEEASKLLLEVSGPTKANPTEYVLIEGIEKAESEIKKIQDLAISRYIETRIKDSAERFPATTIATNGKIDFMKNENKQTLQNGL